MEEREREGEERKETYSVGAREGARAGAGAGAGAGEVSDRPRSTEALGNDDTDEASYETSKRANAP